MAEYIFGIYGFDFSTRSQVRDIELIPLYSYPECRHHGQDKGQFLLTGYGRLPPDTEERHVASYTATIHRLADGMTFCQQQYVLPTRLIRVSAGDTIDAMIESERLATRLLPLLQSRHSDGAVIGCDTFFLQSRTDFLERFLDHLGRDSNELTAALTAALYRKIEIWRLSKSHVELEFFLAFSGLELLARAYEYSGKAANRISRLLEKHGFDVSQTLAQEWCSARDKLFHEGKLEAYDRYSKKKYMCTNNSMR